MDFAAHARALGAKVYEVHTPLELRKALEAVRGDQGVRVIVAHVDPEQRTPGYAFWDVPVAEVSDHPEVRAARERYEEAIKRRRWFL